MFFEQDVLNEVAESIKDVQTIVATFSSSFTTHTPPLPYNATELQADMNGKFGYSLKKTMDITQILRDEYRAITYNRSDCQYLSTEHYNEAPDVISQVMKNIGVFYPVDYQIKSKCFNDGKITAHHGIIPQMIALDLDGWSDHKDIKKDDLINVYRSICERYIMQFLRPKEIETCTGSFTIQGYSFSYTSSKVIDLGFESYFPLLGEGKESNTPFIPPGDYKVSILDSEIYKKRTKAPTRYTPKTLVKDMASIAKYVTDKEIRDALIKKDADKTGENGSIGTVATRASIVESLLNYGYLCMLGKFIISTQKGRAFCSIIPDKIKNPDQTAKWWLMQENIINGKENVNSIMEDVMNDFNENKDTYYQSNDGNSVKDAVTTKDILVGSCPWCGKPVYRFEGKNGTYYSHKKDVPCSFSFSRLIKVFGMECKLDDDNKVKALLSPDGLITLAKDKDGFQNKVHIKIDSSPDKYNGRDTIKWIMNKCILGYCPWCKAEIVQRMSKYGIFYTHKNKSDCSFSLSRSQKVYDQSIELTDTRVGQLLNKGFRYRKWKDRDGKLCTVHISIDPNPNEYKGKKYPRFIVEHN